MDDFSVNWDVEAKTVLAVHEIPEKCCQCDRMEILRKLEHELRPLSEYELLQEGVHLARDMKLSIPRVNGHAVMLLYLTKIDDFDRLRPLFIPCIPQILRAIQDPRVDDHDRSAPKDQLRKVIRKLCGNEHDIKAMLADVFRYARESQLRAPMAEVIYNISQTEYGIYLRPWQRELAELARDPSPDVRIYALRAAASSLEDPSTEIIDAFIGALGIPDDGVLDAAMAGLSRFQRYVSNVEPLRDVAEDIITRRNDRHLLKSALLLLGSVAHRTKGISGHTVNRICEFASSGDEELKIAAFRAIGDLVRAGAISEYGKIPDVVENALSTPGLSESVVKSALNAAIRLIERDGGPESLKELVLRGIKGELGEDVQIWFIENLESAEERNAILYLKYCALLELISMPKLRQKLYKPVGQLTQ